MYNIYYRNKVENPEHYDRMIALIMLHNPACTGEEWACDTINNCISQALSNGGDAATGMVMALKTRQDKVRLFLEPIGYGHVSQLGRLVAQQHTPSDADCTCEVAESVFVEHDSSCPQYGR